MKTIQLPGIALPVALDAPISSNSPHFSWFEATKGGARIPQSESIVANIIRIADQLEAIRAEFGGRVITITSWYRPPDINRNVGGKPGSHHLSGDAVDLIIAGLDPLEVTARIAKRWVGGVGDSPAFTHIDLGPNRRWNY